MKNDSLPPVLSEEALDTVSGGITTSEIIEKIDSLFLYVPVAIRESVKAALVKYGPRAAYSLALRLTRGTPYEGLSNLIPH